MKQIVTLLYLIVLSGHLHAQPYTLFNYSVPEGFPSVEIYEVYQDRQGFIWFSTDNGVIKFDGKIIQTFHVKDGLNDPVVFGLSEDRKGRIWFRTFSGKVSYYDQGKIYTYPHNDKLTQVSSTSLITSLYCDSLDQLWFTAGEFFGKIDKHGHLTTDVAEPSLFYVATVEDYQLPYYYSTDKPIQYLCFDGKRFPIELRPTSHRRRMLSAKAHDGKLYCSIDGDVFEYDGTSLKKVINSQGNAVICLSTDQNDNLWVGYLNGGAQRYDRATFKDPWTPDFLEKKSITKVLQDNEGGFWFTSLEKGAFYVPNLQIRNFSLPMDSKLRTVLSAGNSIVVGDQSGNVYTFDHLFRQTRKTSLDGALIMSSYMDRNQNIWVASIDNLFVLDSTLHTKKVYRTANAIDFAEDRKGNVWSYGGNRIRKFSPQAELLLDRSLRFIYRSLLVEDSLIFLSGRVGLKVLNKNFDIIKAPEALASYKISDMLYLNDSTILVTTMGSGFLLLNKHTWETRQFDSEHRFIANNIYSILKNDSTLWLGTERGVARINISELLQDSVTFDYLTKRSGLISNKTNFLLQRGNSILAFADEGVSVIPCAFTRFATKNPKFYMKDMLVNNEPINPTDEVKLHYDRNNLEIHFGFISFNNHNIFIRYRLSENDPWLYTNSQELQFSSLAPRDYAIELEYSTDNVEWLPADDHRIEFTIQQPWWKRWYYQLAMIMVVIAIGYVYFRNQLALTRQKHEYLEVINQHQQKLLQTEIHTTERERSRIAKDLHDTVGTNLVALKMMIGQLLQKHHEPLAQQVENQLQGVIHETKEIIYNLTPPGIERYGLFVLLKNQIEKLGRITTTRISFTPYGKDVHNQHLNLVILRVIQELISNSLKHAQAKTISIYTSTFEDRINIIYEDDGIGFSHNDSTRGFGLHNIESRIESVKGQIKFESGDFGISYNIDIPFSS